MKQIKVAKSLKNGRIASDLISVNPVNRLMTWTARLYGSIKHKSGHKAPIWYSRIRVL
jgi:hypothetical protein